MSRGLAKVFRLRPVDDDLLNSMTPDNALGHHPNDLPNLLGQRRK